MWRVASLRTPQPANGHPKQLVCGTQLITHPSRGGGVGDYNAQPCDSKPSNWFDPSKNPSIPRWIVDWRSIRSFQTSGQHTTQISLPRTQHPALNQPARRGLNTQRHSTSPPAEKRRARSLPALGSCLTTPATSHLAMWLGYLLTRTPRTKGRRLLTFCRGWGARCRTHRSCRLPCARCRLLLPRAHLPPLLRLHSNNDKGLLPPP